MARRVRRPVRQKKYEVRFNVPLRPLEHADIEFIVFEHADRLGTLLVSRGAIEWKPYKKQRNHKLAWRQFDDLLYRHSSR